MQRTRFTSLFAALGLGLGLGACELEREPLVEPRAEPPEPAPPEGSEPSGLGHDPKPATATRDATPKPHFAGVPTQFCQAELRVVDQPLLRTESFLEAWNELSPKRHDGVVANIPTTEIDARVALCGQQRCTIDAPRVVQATAAYMLDIGVLIPVESRMLVVPEVGDRRQASTCSGDTLATFAQHGDFVHVRATSHIRHYDYVHHGYGGYGPMAGDCLTDSTSRRDLLIDTQSGELELRIDQTQTGEGDRAWVEVALDARGVTLTGCGDVLELQWTE